MDQDEQTTPKYNSDVSVDNLQIKDEDLKKSALVMASIYEENKELKDWIEFEEDLETSVRIDTEAKLIASEVLKQYGMSLSEGINLFCKQVAMTHSIPFELKVPSERMKKALDELEKKEGKSFKSMEALREDLLS